MVRSSFSILFFIRESKVRKNGNAPIEVIITINGEKCSFPTGKQDINILWLGNSLREAVN